MLFTCVRSILGILLAVTAVLKLHLLLTNPFADIVADTPKLILWFVVVIEAFLIVILFRSGARLALVAALSVFSIFLLVSITRVLLGRVACGCFGAVELPIWVSVIFNVSIVLSLLMCTRRAMFGEADSQRRSINAEKGLNKAIGYFAGSGLAALIFGLYFFGGGVDLVEQLSGMRRVLAPRVFLANLEMGVDSVHAITLNNTSKSKIRVIGKTRSCDCLPISEIDELPPDSFVNVDVVIRPKTKGRFHQRVSFFLDCSTQSTVKIDLFGSAF